MIILSVKGNEEDIGIRHGKAALVYKHEILELYNIKVSKFLKIKNILDIDKYHIPKLLYLLEKWEPDYLAELCAISKILGLDLGQLMLITYASFIERYITQCSVWGYSNSKNSVLVKNRDKDDKYTLLSTLIYSRPYSKYSYIIFTNIGDPGAASCGINERGLAIASTYVPSLDTGLGLTDSVISYHVLRNYDNVDDAIKYIKKVPKIGQYTLTILDKYNSLVVVEVGNKNMDITYYEDYTIRTNHFISDIMSKYHNFKSELKYEDSKRRYEILTRRLTNLSEISLDTIKKMMSYHDDRGFSLCKHPGDLNENTRTICMTVMIPSEKKVFFTPYNPCESPILEIKISSDGYG